MTGSTPATGASAPSAPSSPAPAPASGSPGPAPSSGTGAPAAPSGVVESSATARLEADNADARRVLDWDPFAPPEPAAAAPAAPAAIPPASDPAAVVPPGGTGTPAPRPAPAAPTDLATALQTISRLTEQLNRPAQPAPAAAPAGPPQDDIPAYQFEPPAALIALLRSEDQAEFGKGVTFLLSGVGRAIHKTITNQLRGEFMTVLQNHAVQRETYANVAKTVAQDYYGTFKDHNTEILRPIVTQVTQQVIQETGAKSWSEPLRNLIGTRVEAYLTQIRGGTAPAAPAAPLPTAPPHMASPGARPAEIRLPDQQSQMLDLLSP